MKSLTTNLLTCTTAALAVALLLAPAHVGAVVKSFQVMKDGTPVANTEVTLTSPSRRTYTEVTDAEGRVLGFNFNEDGDWDVTWEGGSMVISTGGGIGPWLVGATAIGVTGFIIAANDSDNDDVSSIPSPPTGDVSGQYTMNTTVDSNPDMHPNNFENCTYNVDQMYEVSGSASNGDLTIDCSGPNISFTATGTLVDDAFSATGTGTYEGITTQFQIDGGFGEDSWSGQAAAGTDGSLPDSNDDGMNDPIVVTFTGDRVIDD